MTGPGWSNATLHVRPVSEHHPEDGVYVRIDSRAAMLGPELTRSLAGWLEWWCGHRDAPSDPDRVRVAIDLSRSQLRALSGEADTTEDFRAGLAWAENALNQISGAAS